MLISLVSPIIRGTPTQPLYTALLPLHHHHALIMLIRTNISTRPASHGGGSHLSPLNSSEEEEVSTPTFHHFRQELLKRLVTLKF